MTTVTAIMAGLVPLVWSQGTGADVMKRIAAPMVGGMLTWTVLTLVVIPAVYSLWREPQFARGVGKGTEDNTAGATARGGRRTAKPGTPEPSPVVA
jgi:hypothetical protein